MHNFVAFAAVVLCFLVVVTNWVIWRDIKNPAVLHSIMWWSIVALHAFVPHGFYELTFATYLIVFASMILFSLGTIIGYEIKGARGSDISMSLPKPKPNGQILKAYFILALIGVPLYIKKAFELSSHGYADNFMIDLRYSLTDENDLTGYGATAYFSLFAFAYFFISLLDKNVRLTSRRIIVSFLICMVYVVLATGRTYLFLLFIPSLFIIALTRPKFLTLSKAGLSVAALFLVFFSVGSVLNKLGDGRGEDATATFWLYLLGGITAFQENMANSNFLEYGSNTFRTFYAVAASLGFDVEVKKLMQDYTFIPTPTNVYTVFQPYYRDLGIYYALFVQFLFGMLHAKLYKSAKKLDPRAILFYSVSMYPLFMQWFQDQYALLMTTWLLFVVIFMLPFVNYSRFKRARFATGLGERFED